MGSDEEQSATVRNHKNFCNRVLADFEQSIYCNLLCYNINNGNWTERSAIWSEIRPKLHYMKFNYHFITPILKSLIFWNLYWSTRLVCKKLNQKCVYMYMWTKQNDRCHFTKTHRSAKETRVNFIHANVQAWVLKSCYCKNSLLQSFILIVWLNNISPWLLQRLWLRHRVFLGEKIQSTASVILTKKNYNLLST